MDEQRGCSQRAGELSARMEGSRPRRLAHHGVAVRPHVYHRRRYGKDQHATLALEAGESIDAVSRALGHSSIATTADVYGHWTPVMAQRLADRMDAVLGG
jgi:integrase